MGVQDREFNLKQLKAVATAFGDLLDKITFVGGATTALLVPEVAGSGVRQTNDVDVIVDIVSRLDYVTFSEKLRQKGFSEDSSTGAPMCRWTIKDLNGSGNIIVDIMPVVEEILGFTNRWYKEGIAHAKTVELPDSDFKINVLSPGYFLATKFEAFNNRGKGNLFSHDLEDIIFVIENRRDIILELKEYGPEIKEYLSKAIISLSDNDDFFNYLPGLLTHQSSQKNVESVLTLISKLD